MVDKSQVKIPKVEPVDLGKLPIKLPKVDIDYSKCTVPLWCKKCIQSCPQLVFSVHCKQMAKSKESDPREPGVYEVLAIRRDKCIMCNKCVEACPEGAITVSFGDTVLKGSKKFSTAEEARKSPYQLWAAPPRPFSFEMDADMLESLRNEFATQKLVARFAEAIKGKSKDEIDRIAREIFSDYGKAWMEKVLKLGEEYADRTYEVMKEVVDQTGDYFFPLVPQRFIEIAYLSTQELLKLTILENWKERLVYQVPKCLMYRNLQEQCGPQTASLMPCKETCLSALKRLFTGLDLYVTLDIEKETARDGLCQFKITRKD